MKEKVNIIVDNDNCWLLNTVKNLLILFKKNDIHINSIWVLPEKLSYLKGIKIKQWYFELFGIFNALKLSCFYLLVLIFNLTKKQNSFSQLAKKNKIKINYIKSLKDKNLKKYLLKEKKKQFIIIFTNHILPKNLLKIKNCFFVNKHASLLPSFAGLFPYIRTKIFNFKNGITIHLVIDKIDSGKILYQKVFNKEFKSMIDFYIYVFENSPKYLLESIKSLKKKKFVKPKYSLSRYSLPSKKEFNYFLDCGGEVINISDFLRIKNLVRSYK